MSVGLQRLRNDALRLRQGALDKGEDPEAVDRAVALDVQRRELAAEADGLRAARRKLSEEIAAAVRGGADPAGPQFGDLKARSAALGRRIDELDA
ncbi:MAG: hypothetical protein ACXWPJ_11375, partial [Candidatus Limnocylindrales bacterium]